MRKSIFFVVTVMLLCWNAANAQHVNVTFRANLATVPDTLGPNSVVQIRGTTITAAGHSADDASIDTLAPGVLLAWNGHSTMFLKHIEGDYWEATFPIPAGSKIAYKFFTNSAHDTVYSGADWEHKGWEDNIKTIPGIYSGNRGLDLTTFTGTDTTLPLQFVNGIKYGAEQYFRPYTETDSIDVWFRVNMEGWEDFNDQTQVVGVRGGVSPGYLGDLSWDHTFFLTQEKKHSNTGQCDYNGKYFWSGHVRIPKESVSAGQEIEYKFVIMSKGDPDDADPLRWEDSNRSFTISSTKSDTTLYWVWFNNKPPVKVVHTDNVNITFLVDMARAIQNRGFAFGDTIEARVGYFATAKEVKTIQLQRQGFTTFYMGSVDVTTTIGNLIDYQYYAWKRGRDYREVYYNFYYTGEISGEAERRQVEVTGSTMVIADTVYSKGDSRRMPFFRNISVVAQDVLVTYTCDVRPAYYQLLIGGGILKDIQGNVDVTHPDSVLAWGVAMNGPATGGWSDPLGGPDWGRHLMDRETKRMYDDGTHGDAVAGDSVFTIQFQYHKDSLDVVGQEFKFGIGGGDNEGGYGNNHIENIDDSQPTCIIASQFGSIDPVSYWAWDYDKGEPSAVEKLTENIPLKYALEQNYPNPFNPETCIKYSIMKPEKVTLSIYNLLGEKVVTLIDKKQLAGSYVVVWDGRDTQGRIVSSGVYFYKIKAGNFVKTNKMLLLR